MVDEAKVRRVAEHLAKEHVRRADYKPLTGDMLPADMDEAYACQRALVALWSAGDFGPVGGYKIALTSKPMQEMVGVDKPCGGAIFTSIMHASPATISVSEYQHVGLEFELAIRLGRDVPVSGEVYSADSIRPYVDAAMPAFELIEDRNADYSTLEAMSLIAENSWCGGIVFGEPSAAWAELDLTDTPVRLDYNGETAEANTGAAMGNPLSALAWIANLLAERDQELRAGMIVMTGSTMPTRFPVPGDHVRYTVEGLGEVELRAAD